MIKLKEILEERGIQQKAFAKDLKLATTTLNNYVCGRREPDIEMIRVFCDALGITADYLLGRSSNPAPAVSDADAALLHAYHAAPLSIQAAITTLLQPYQKESEADQAI